jgi:DNA polymerase III gamma/tau subunit
METSLIGQADSIATLNQTLKDPPHLFLSGGYGSGKTTLVNDFLKAYYAPHKISYMDPEWTLWLSSEQDRGIHCVRESVAEFARHTSARPGVYRWIVIDDADSLPMISQQALRRPMETHAHTTRFLFASRHIADIIQPIKSRCLHIELDTLPPIMLFYHFCKKAGYPDIRIEHEAIGIFLSLARTPTELKNIANILCKIHGTSKEPVAVADILCLFAAPSFSLCLQLLKAYIQKDNEAMQKIFLEIWNTGISYEDFLHELVSTTHQMGILSPQDSQEINQLILKGWISFAQGKTHSLDLMRLFFRSEA